MSSTIIALASRPTSGGTLARPVNQSRPGERRDGVRETRVTPADKVRLQKERQDKEFVERFWTSQQLYKDPKTGAFPVKPYTRPAMYQNASVNGGGGSASSMRTVHVPPAPSVSAFPKSGDTNGSRRWNQAAEYATKKKGASRAKGDVYDTHPDRRLWSPRSQPQFDNGTGYYGQRQPQDGGGRLRVAGTDGGRRQDYRRNGNMLPPPVVEAE